MRPATAGGEQRARSRTPLTTKNSLEASAAQRPRFGSRARAFARSSRPVCRSDSRRATPGIALSLRPSRHPTFRSACLGTNYPWRARIESRKCDPQLAPFARVPARCTVCAISRDEPPCGSRTMACWLRYRLALARRERLHPKRQQRRMPWPHGSRFAFSWVSMKKGDEIASPKLLLLRLRSRNHAGEEDGQHVVAILPPQNLEHHVLPRLQFRNRTAVVVQ